MFESWFARYRKLLAGGRWSGVRFSAADIAQLRRFVQSPSAAAAGFTWVEPQGVRCVRLSLTGEPIGWELMIRADGSVVLSAPPGAMLLERDSAIMEITLLLGAARRAAA